MRLIKPSFKILKQEEDYLGVCKQIELAGRTCYKSEDRITETSAKEFVDKMIKSGHGAMLEHGTIYLKYDSQYNKDLECIQVLDKEELNEIKSFIRKYQENKYSKINYNKNDIRWILVTTNLRVLVENDWLDDLQYICESTEYHEKRVTAKFICDRGVSHEFVRHRVFSFAQESTRYCNYSKDKFGNDCTFIIPCWLDEADLIDEFGDLNSLEYHKDIEKFQSSEWSDAANFLQSIAWSESNYLTLLDNEWTPQQARSVLPNSLKTELVMTGFVSDWKGFFTLRDSNAAHPQARELAIPLKEEFINLNLIK